MKVALHPRRMLHVFILLLLLTGLIQFAPIQPEIAQGATPGGSAEIASVSASAPPVLLKDIYTANASSNPHNFYDFGSRFFFSASDLDHGNELWVSDGTLAGTKLLKDITAGKNSTSFYDFADYHEKVYFTTGQDLYATDGTTEQTTLIYHSSSDENSPSMVSLQPIGDWLYIFFSNNKLRRYNDVSGEMQIVLPNDTQYVRVNNQFAVMNGALYFSGASSTSGFELWRLDVTSGQAALVKDICPATCGEFNYAPGSHPGNMTVIGDMLFFTASDETHGTELWASNGSEGGTILLKDIYEGVESANPQSLTAVADWLYFSADDGAAHGRELWRSDGTPGNTALVADTAAGPVSSIPQELTYRAASNQLFFTARDALPGQGHGLELWTLLVTSAGVPASPQLLEIFPGLESSLPAWLTTVGNTLYFVAQNTPGNIELWKLEGAASPVQVADLVPGPDGSDPKYLDIWNGKLVFNALDAIHGRELWISDGTAAGTALVDDLAKEVDIDGSITSNNDVGSGGIMTRVGGTGIRYFTARDALHGTELWRTDGTPSGTWLVKDTDPGPNEMRGMMYCDDMAEMNGILYFCSTDSDHGEALWRSDGTTAGTWIVKNLYPGYPYANPHKLTAAGETLFFIAEGPNKHQLWASDGTEDGTLPIMDFSANHRPPITEEMAGVKNTLIFSVMDQEQAAAQLWRSNGTVAGTKPFYGPFHYDDDFGYFGPVKWMRSFGEKVYLNMNNVDIPGGAMDGSNDRLWVTDGTTNGTKVFGPASEPFPYSPQHLIQVGSVLYFTARSTLPGSYYDAEGIWKLPIGSTSPSQVVRIPYYDKTPQYMTSLGGGEKLLLHTKDPFSYVQSELWTIDLSTSTIEPVWNGGFPMEISFATQGLGKVFFQAGDGYYGDPTELWVTDGTQEGTARVTAPGIGQEFLNPGAMFGTLSVFYFSVDDDIYGREPWIMGEPLDHSLYLPAVRR